MLLFLCPDKKTAGAVPCRLFIAINNIRVKQAILAVCSLGDSIKRRTVANEACDAEKVIVNGKAARASYEVKTGDIIEILIGKPLKVRVTEVREFTKKEDAAALYEVVAG